MTRAEIADRLRAERPLVAWDLHVTCDGSGPNIAEEVAAIVERIIVERTADLCAEVHRLRARLSAFTHLERADEIRRGHEMYSPKESK